MLISLSKVHRRVAEIVRHCTTSRDHTHLLIWSRWKPAAGEVMVSVFFLGVLLVCNVLFVVLCMK
jgi:hypothetical protein